MIHLDITPELEEDIQRIIELEIDLDTDPDNKQTITLLFDSEDMQSGISTLIDKGMNAAITNKKDVKSLMMKSSLNAALIGFGPFLIDMFWCGKPEEKPKPGRKDDLIEWYARFIVSQLVVILQNTVIHLSGKTIGLNDVREIIKIVGMCTKSIS